MISSKLRLLLILLFLICGLVSVIAQLDHYITFAFFTTAIILLLGHFRHGPMLGVLLNLRKGNIPQTESMLNSIKRPEWLSSRYQAYYHFALSLVASHKQDFESAKVHSLKALESGFLQNKEKSILYYNLARVAYEKKDWDTAKNQLNTLEELKIEDLHLKKRIQELEEALKHKA
ncbi:MAG: hypothetical protein MK207_01760 [Saprospiraceae bacterium]|nr:hypothetical protein [Saprospiraceae bacterium]